MSKVCNLAINQRTRSNTNWPVGRLNGRPSSFVTHKEELPGALLERVSTLLRGNLNDMIDRAEDRAKMLKQVLLDMDSQLLQVKTQVAIAIADQHLLKAKVAEHEATIASWRRKAQLALDKNDEPLVRIALERTLQSEQLLTGYQKQLDDQRLETESLRDSYTHLQAKLEETRAEGELLMARQRRARNAVRPAKHLPTAHVIARIKDTIINSEATKTASRSLEAPDQTIEDRFLSLEREERIDALLNELKSEPRLLSR
jgi:phage shock protein A